MKQDIKLLRGKATIQKNGDKITVIASDETLDRHGDVLPIDQWDLSKFKLSPRMLVDHNHEVASIVGKWANSRIEDGKLMMDAVFHDFTDLAKAVKNMVNEGFLDTVSVGFIMHGPTQDGGKDSFELIETSWVTVPANPSARVLKDLLEKSISPDAEQKVKEFADEEEIENSDDVLPEEEEEEETGEDKEDEEDEGVVSDDEDAEVRDYTAEAMIENGWLVIECAEDFEQWKAVNKIHGNHLSLCATLYLEKLLEDSEKLKELTKLNADKAKAEKHAKLVRESMKEAARIINRSLQVFNESDRA